MGTPRTVVRRVVRPVVVAAAALAAVGTIGVGGAHAVDQDTSLAFEQPQVRMRVTPVVELTAATLADSIAPRAMRHETGESLRDAPMVPTSTGEPTKIIVTGLVATGTYAVKVKTYGESQRMRQSAGYSTIGSVRVNALGRVQLPVFTPTSPGSIVIALVARSGDTEYVKVSVS